MQTWEYRTLIAPNRTFRQLLKEEWHDAATLGNLVELDRYGETEIGTALHDLGSDGWELIAAVPVEALVTQPSPELLLIFKRPKD